MCVTHFVYFHYIYLLSIIFPYANFSRNLWPVVTRECYSSYAFILFYLSYLIIYHTLSQPASLHFVSSHDLLYVVVIFKFQFYCKNETQMSSTFIFLFWIHDIRLFIPISNMSYFLMILIPYYNCSVSWYHNIQIICVVSYYPIRF